MLDASNYLRTAFFLGPIDVYGPGHRVSCERLAFVMAAQTTVVRKTSINGVTLSLLARTALFGSLLVFFVPACSRLGKFLY